MVCLLLLYISDQREQIFIQNEIWYGNKYILQD